jgi:hypothetical protein
VSSPQNIARNTTLASCTSVSQGQSFGDDDEIIKQVRQEGLDGADNDSDDLELDSDNNIEPETRDNIVALCRQMEHVGMTSTDLLGAELANLARKFHGLVVQQSMDNEGDDEDERQGEGRLKCDGCHTRVRTLPHSHNL